MSPKKIVKNRVWNGVLKQWVEVVSHTPAMMTASGGDKINADDVVNDLTTAASGKMLTTETKLITAVAGAIPLIRETAPSNSVNEQLWHQPVGSIEV